MKKLIVGLMTAVLLAGTGCASLSTGASDPAVQAGARIAIQYGTMKFIDEDAHRAERVLTFIDSALTIVDENETATMEDMTIKIQALIPFDKMDLADRILVANLVEAVVLELKRRVDVPETAPVAEVRTVLLWVKQAAELSVPN